MFRFLFLLGVCLGSAWAQFDSAAILGTVADSSGLPVKGAKVTLRNTQTDVQESVSTNENGGYQFPSVRIGSYRVVAEAAGFKQADSGEFRLTVGARQRVDLQLQVGQVTETVTVSEAVKILETDTSARGTVVAAEQIVNLPLNGRSYADLALLAPGVRKSAIADSREASFNVNGMRSSQNNFVIDGVDNNAYGTSNQGFSSQAIQLSPDAVQEFRLETNNFSAEYGRAGGAVINATIRSGTNDFHGSAYEFLRNTSLNATGFFKPVDNVKPTLIQNQFGGTFGGAIIRDRLFIFGDYEGYRRISKTLSFVDLPTADQKAGRMGIPIRNPFTGEVYSNGVIPASAMTRYGREVLAALPDPNYPSRGPNSFASLPRRADQTDKGDVRSDYYLNSRLNFFGRYSHRLMENFEPPSIPGASGGNANGNVRVLNKQLALGSTYMLNPTSLLEFRLGLTWTEGGKTPVFVGTQSIGERFGIPNVPNDPRFTGGIPATSINGYSQIGVQGSNPQYQNPFVWNPKISYSKILSRHTIKAGYEHQSIATQVDDFNPKAGSYTFGGRYSQVPGTANNNAQFVSDFLFGAVSQYSINNPAIANLRQRMDFFYLADDYKVSTKLTINAGVRYEYGTPQWEADNKLANFDPATQTLIQAKNGSIFDRALVNPDRNNWAPRLGIAYTVTPKTVIRSAYGISYIHFNRMGGENLLAYNLPNVLNPTATNPNPLFFGNETGLPVCSSTSQALGTCFRTMEQGFPDGFLSVSNVNTRNVRVNQIPFNLRSGYTQSWHFTVQRQLPGNWVLDVAYVGNRSVKLMALGDLNQAAPQPVDGPTVSLNDRRPYKAYGFIQTAFDGGFLNYHALQVKAERRFQKGFYFLNSFTWSKAIDNVSGHLEANNGDNSRMNIRNPKSERGVSGYNQPFNNTSTLLYDVPWKWKGGTQHLFGGWRATMINTIASGLPVNISYNADSRYQVSTTLTYRPDAVAGVDAILPENTRSGNAAFYLNRAAFGIPAAGNQPFGNLGRNVVVAPSLWQTDLGIHKTFPVWERVKMDFRAEFFNLFNRTNFGSPNGNISSTSFGQITSLAARPREIQFALRFAF